MTNQEHTNNPLGIHCPVCSVEQPCDSCLRQITSEAAYALGREHATFDRRTYGGRAVIEDASADYQAGYNAQWNQEGPQ